MGEEPSGSVGLEGGGAGDLGALWSENPNHLGEADHPSLTRDGGKVDEQLRSGPRGQACAQRIRQGEALYQLAGLRPAGPCQLDGNLGSISIQGRETQGREGDGERVFRRHDDRRQVESQRGYEQARELRWLGGAQEQGVELAA